MKKKDKKKKEEEKQYYGPKVAENELVFGVAHIFSSFNDTFVVKFSISALSRCVSVCVYVCVCDCLCFVYNSVHIHVCHFAHSHVCVYIMLLCCCVLMSFTPIACH